jgi:hypothetical protein
MDGRKVLAVRELARLAARISSKCNNRERRSVGKKKSKSGKHALPKRIAGVKIPKALRKAGGKALANAPLVSEIIAASLIAAAAALSQTEAGGKVVRKAKKRLQSLKQDGLGDNDLAGAISAAITSAVEHWSNSRDESARKASPAGPATQH